MSGTRCILFFPGSRPELLTKAIASGAERVCIDLEDAVAPESKLGARANVLELLTAPDASARLVVRINHPSSPEGQRDLEALGGLGRLPYRLTVMIPKVDARPEVDSVTARLGQEVGRVSAIPIIETARGLANVEEIAEGEHVSALLLGGLDLSLELGCALDWEALLYARSRCVHAARLAGVDLVDTPFFDVEDEEGLRREAERGRRLGFTAKAAIHPSQVPTIRRAYEPSDQTKDRARRVLEASEREPEGAFLLDGVMVDRPGIEAARRRLSRADGEEE